MAFSVKTWQNTPSTATPLNGAGLIDLETRLSSYTDSVAATTASNAATDAQTKATAAQTAAVTPGDLKLTAAISVPSGWLACDGTAVSRTTYSALFSAVGTAYGAGDGSSSFNLPDLRGRTPVGVDGGTGRVTSSNTRGATGGADKVALSTAEQHAHHHGYLWPVTQRTSDGITCVMLPQDWAPLTNLNVYDVLALGFPSPQQAYAPHYNTDAVTVDTNAAAHNNMPPYQVFTWLIKT